MKRSELYEKHKALGAKFIDFHGWETPLEYSGVIKEHEAVRSAAGLFDVSHMGTLEVGGADSIKFLRRTVTFRPETLPVDNARYAFLLNERAGIKDDLMVFRLNDDRFLLVVNAATMEKDLGWLKLNAQGFDAVLIDDTPDTAILALQGPASWDIVRKVFGIDPAGPGFKYHGFVNSTFSGTGFILSKTGYTGEKGFEIYIHRHTAGKLWDALMEAGGPFGMVPCGLGARDTLRLEMGYLLYGQDADEDTDPIEAGYEGMVDFDNADFIGRDALLKVKAAGPKKKLTALALKEHGVPRSGCAITAGGETVGAVTSGNFSPMLKKGIALGYVKAGAPMDDLKIVIREKPHEAEVILPPFYRRK
jgi:aminomethyltransferase